jgi:CDP-diacylglycerol---serine O-phosphatidyltransferase
MLKQVIPNFLTSSNLFCGVMAIILAFEGKHSQAVLAIIFAMILDAMDGRTARLLKVESEFGKELDSLADVITFGLAPALLIYTLTLHQYGWFGLFITGLFPVLGSIRLARFNTDKYKSINYFVGMPITAAGGILAILTLNYFNITDSVLISVMIVLAFLMVSSFKFPSFKKIRIPLQLRTVSIVLIILFYASLLYFQMIYSLLSMFSMIFFLLFAFHTRNRRVKKNSNV